jgi:hypothetical protein
MTLHALLPREIGEVGSDTLPLAVFTESWDLHEPLDLTPFDAEAGDVEDRIARALLFLQSHLVVTIREVACGRSMQAGVKVADLG